MQTQLHGNAGWFTKNVTNKIAARMVWDDTDDALRDAYKAEYDEQDDE